MNELSKFLSDVKEITCIEYVGSPKDRQKIWDMFSAKGDSIFVTRYVLYVEYPPTFTNYLTASFVAITFCAPI